MIYKTLDYFARNPINPRFSVFYVLDDNAHPEYENLICDLNSIEKNDLDLFLKNHHISDTCICSEDKELKQRARYLAYELQKYIANARFRELLDFNSRPEPYNSNNLFHIELDKHYLISTSYFDLKHLSFQVNDFVYELCPITGASNSSYFIFQEILKCIYESNVNFRVRLNPFIEIQSAIYQSMHFKMQVYGTPLKWEHLLRLQKEDFGQWMSERGNSWTDYIWAPNDDEIHFTCEEYPCYNFDGLSSSRYFHAIFNKCTGGIKHCDGAIRVYDHAELESRRNYHVRQAEVRKVGKRVKIFQFESIENNGKELSQDDFCRLVPNFFVWNEDVFNYFNVSE